MATITTTLQDLRPSAAQIRARLETLIKAPGATTMGSLFKYLEVGRKLTFCPEHYSTLYKLFGLQATTTIVRPTTQDNLSATMFKSDSECTQERGGPPTVLANRPPPEMGQWL